jgi:GH15 family glucan-1,4-alpha-glucosidase
LPRHVLVSNGHFAVALDEGARIRDFYFPYVGLENHAVGHPFRFGVSLDGNFEWIEDGWDIKMTYMPETLTTRYVIAKPSIGISMEVNDAVHPSINVFLRKIKISNDSDTPRDAKLFFTQDFHIYGDEAGDTAFFDPKLTAVIHYKRKRYFLVGGSSTGTGFYQYAIGYKEVEGKDGTWRDAEDSQLSNNPVAQGSVDSAVSLKLNAPAHNRDFAYYWIACGTDISEVTSADATVKRIGVEQMLLETENYWSAWLNRLNIDLNILPRDVARLFKRSLLLMRAHVDNHGGLLASLDSDILGIHRDTYSYVWPRDAAMAALAFTSAGFTEVPTMLFGFCNGVIGDNGYFRHKYLPDGSLGSTWHALVDTTGRQQLPIQEDETASILYALWRYFERGGNLEFVTKVYDRLVVKASDFMLQYRDPQTKLPKPTFDEWEEKVGVFTSTVAAVCAALEAAGRFAKVFYDSKRQEALGQASTEIKQTLKKHLYDPQLKRFIKGIYSNGEKDTTLDSSVSTVFAYGVLDAKDPMVVSTMEALARDLWVRTEVGGLARYQNDRYRRVSEAVPGNPWFISTLRLARWHTAKASRVEELSSAMDLIKWASKNALPSGALAEQLDPYSGKPVSATPLVWSHAEYVLAVCDYVGKYGELTSSTST